MSETKSLKKPTTKGKDLPVPESVNWLLDFFNIKSIAGEYNPRKLLFAKKPNRTPTVPPENPETEYVTDHKGYVYVPSFDNEPECIGKEKFFPTSNDFREYFESCKIRNASIVKNEDMFQKISWLWNDLSMAFARLVTANQPIDTERLLSKGVVIDTEEEQEIGQSVIKAHCDSYLKNYDEETQRRILFDNWLPDIKGIPDVIYIGILTWLNCKELHTLLRQCKGCGAFWIDEQKQIGRPRDFCINKRCGNIFSPAPREKEEKDKKANRKTKRKTEKAKIIKYTTENKFELIYVDDEYVHRCVSKERANEIYEEWIKQKSRKNAISLAEFIRTEAKDW